MNTSPGAAMCPRLNMRRIIARTLLFAGVLLALVACSAARVAYNQAPSLAYWWIDGYADLNDGQSVQLRQDIDRFFDWHRRQELPVYASRLVQWQALAAQDITADQVCQQFDALRAAYLRAGERGVEPLARLALQLSPEQLQHLARHQEKGNQGFEKEFLRGSAEQRLENRLDKAIDRYETLYGTLTDSQRRLIQTGLQQSPFDPQRSQAERQRRQAALLQTIRLLQATQGSAWADNGSRPVPAAAVEAARAYVQRLLKSPTPGYADHTEALVRHGCAQFAALHNSTSPSQREHAAQVLQGYADDLRALARQD